MNEQKVKSQNQKVLRGFTLLELLTSLGVISLLLVVTIPPFLNFRRTSILNTDTESFVALIDEARFSAISSKDDRPYGVHLESDKVVLFPGTTYVAGSNENEEYVFNTALTLAPITVYGGGSEIVFQKITGATTQNATATLSVIGGTASSTIVVQTTGSVTVQ